MARYPFSLTTTAARAASSGHPHGSARPDVRPFLSCDALPGVQLPGQLIGIGENFWPGTAGGTAPYRRSRDRIPLVFGKFPGSLAADGQEIMLDPDLSATVVAEGELAVVMGRTLRDAAGPEDALSAVAGVTVANDVSARDLQAADVQSTRGKSLDSFCPLGPDLVTLDELPDLQELRIITRINGAAVQDAPTADMVFPVAELIIFCSRFMTLYPGDVILTGTPFAADESGLELRPGDIVTVDIPGVGVLTNPVTSRPGRRTR